jgi:hypothetical protein
MLQTQRRMIDGMRELALHFTYLIFVSILEQDEQLDRLSHSINRQHHISLQINDELDVHAGLLEELDTDLNRTESRMTTARRRLDRVAKGAKENGQPPRVIFKTLALISTHNTQDPP